MIKIAGLVAAFVVAIGLAFYGGRAYQNNIDQPLFTAYTPPKTTAGGGFRSSSFFGSGAAGGGGQVAAALALATPPTSGGQLGSAGAAPTASSQKAAGTAASAPGKKASGATGTTGAGGSGAVPGASGAPAAGATATDVAGTLQSIDGQSVKVKTSQGALQSVTLSAATSYYLAETASPSALKVGQKVTLGLQPNPSGGFGAGSVTIAPPGTLYGYVRPATASTGAGGGGAGGFGFSLAATLTAVSGNSITATNATGRSFTIALTSSTPIYQLVPVAATKLIAGATVSVHAMPASRKLTATNVVASKIQGMTASLTTQQARRRTGGFGGNGGGGNGGGFGGAGGGGGSAGG